jgi:hypothetical protein
MGQKVGEGHAVGVKSENLVPMNPLSRRRRRRRGEM